MALSDVFGFFHFFIKCIEFNDVSNTVYNIDFFHFWNQMSYSQLISFEYIKI